MKPGDRTTKVFTFLWNSLPQFHKIVLLLFIILYCVYFYSFLLFYYYRSLYHSGESISVMNKVETPGKAIRVRSVYFDTSSEAVTQFRMGILTGGSGKEISFDNSTARTQDGFNATVNMDMVYNDTFYATWKLDQSKIDKRFRRYFSFIFQTTQTKGDNFYASRQYRTISDRISNVFFDVTETMDLEEYRGGGGKTNRTSKLELRMNVEVVEYPDPETNVDGGVFISMADNARNLVLTVPYYDMDRVLNRSYALTVHVVVVHFVILYGIIWFVNGVKTCKKERERERNREESTLLK